MKHTTNLRSEGGRRFAIGDVHGCLKTLKTLLFERLEITREDQIYFLGDYVHRGPDSQGVLSLIYTLQKDGYQVTPLMGNHEEMYMNEEGDTIPYHLLQMIRKMPRHLELEDYILVHAGFNFSGIDPLEDEEAMIWGPIGYLTPDPAFTKGRKIICGHRPTSAPGIQELIEEDSPVIIIDNGCYKALDRPSKLLGKLCALNLDTLELTFQPNVEENRYRSPLLRFLIS